MHKSPWQTIESTPIYENKWISLIEDQVITPGGNKGIYGRVCMKSKAIGILPIDPEMNTWLVGQYRYTLDEYSWEIPMGGSDPDESPQKAARRELYEETGIKAGKLTEFARVHTSNSITDEEGWIFIAEELVYQNPEPDDTEQLVVKKLPLESAIKMAISGEITDSISVIALLKMALRKPFNS